MHVVVTGGAGYIGSNVVRALLADGVTVTVVDDLSSGHRSAVPDGVPFVEGSCGDRRVLDRITAPIDGVMHIAAKCSVGESMENPRAYYDTNLRCSLELLDWITAGHDAWLIHSSTCAVYGNPDRLPLDEDTPTRPINAYGATKLAFDQALGYYRAAYGLRATVMRYFNAAGAQPDGSLGEDKTPASNLLPRVLDVPLGRRDELLVFGTDYATPDGTGIRDYVHVMDLADAHVRAMARLDGGDSGSTYNLGTERGSSVLEVVACARQVTGHAIPLRAVARRPGDPAELVAASARAHADLGWAPARSDLRTVVEDAWRWHQSHPDGHA